MPAVKKERNKNLTVPNALTVLRIFIVPFFAWTFLTGHTIIATILLVASGLSDVLDGIIARKFDQVTELGKMLDPLADKLTQGTVALCLGFRFPVIFPVLAVFFLKEIAMLVCATILLKRKKRPCAAKWYGKVGTAMFYVSVAVIVAMRGVFDLTGTVPTVVAYALLLPTLGMMIYAMIQYFKIFLEILRSDDEEHALDLPDVMGTGPAKDEKEKP